MLFEFVMKCLVACLQRINDPSSGIRILAASIIPKLKPKFGDEPSNNYEQDMWDTFLKRCMDLFLHYDGPEVRLQAAIKLNYIFN
ncbi:hypothetical protein GQX74_009980 [Glossina fuscipes]|nr:hypothetical protein GQX74_009980 [Glossina fuscipes]